MTFGDIVNKGELYVWFEFTTTAIPKHLVRELMFMMASPKYNFVILGWSSCGGRGILDKADTVPLSCIKDLPVRLIHEAKTRTCECGKDKHGFANHAHWCDCFNQETL